MLFKILLNELSKTYSIVLTWTLKFYCAFEIFLYIMGIYYVEIRTYILYAVCTKNNSFCLIPIYFLGDSDSTIVNAFNAVVILTGIW